ncbi:hypothetical protein ACIBEJ_47960 [Nonomuraea sp. NPDC050790]|uniref:hypothetical protein n=1 Tax=Nonomuraea sp. NPDC050790 TaxID=3364371 RepID=UPI0037896A36
MAKNKVPERKLSEEDSPATAPTLPRRQRVTAWIKDHVILTTVCTIISALIGFLALGRDVFDITWSRPGPTTTAPADAMPGATVSGQAPDAGTAPPTAVANRVKIVRVNSVDGEPGLGKTVEVEIEVLQAPSRGHSYWFFSQLTGSDYVNFYAVRRIHEEVGSRRYVQDFSKAPKNYPRYWFVIDVPPNRLSAVLKNHSTLDDTSEDYLRTFPEGGEITSNRFKVVRTRD